MKKFVVLLILTLPLLFSLFIPPIASAQVCIGDSGQPGNCEYAMACPPSNIDGTGTCPNPQICCRGSLPTGDGGTGDCTDACTSSADCLDTPNNLVCVNNVCTNPTVCTSCTGNSGYAGSCLTPGVCDGRGKNSNDGTGSCTMGSICCTNAPSSDSCNISGPPVIPTNTDFTINLNSTDPNFAYLITTSPTGCVGSCLGGSHTPGVSGDSCTLNCSTAVYTITARHGNISCSTTINVQNIPGLVCRGESGLSGYCVVNVCPNGYVGDGVGTCTGSTGCCIRDPEDPFCIPYVSTSGIRTALGCILAADPQALIVQLSSWAIKLGILVLFANIVYAGFLFIASSGDQNKIQASKELLSSSFLGLLIIVVAVLVLNFVGVNILGLDLFGFRL